MTILHPKALAWAMLAVPIVVLYLWRIRPRRHWIATGFLWERVLPKKRPGWWFRQPASLCIQLTILALVVVALAEPEWRAPLRLVLVIDNSASMNAADVKPTRLDEAKRLARQHVAALGYRDEMAILAAGEVVGIHSGLTSRKSALETALRSVTPTDGPTHVVEAVALGRQLLANCPSGKIIVLSDGCFDGAARLAGQDDVQFVPVGSASHNLSITRLEARRSLADPLECQVLIEVTSFSNEPVACRLKLELDGNPVDTVPIELEPDGRWQQVFQMTTAEGGQLTARLDRPDFFAADDHASTPVPPCRTDRVTLVTEGNRYLEKVFEASPLVQLTVTGTPPEGAAEGTILVLHRRLPTRLPKSPMLVIDPTGPCELWRLGEPLEKTTIAEQNDALPLLAGVRLEGVRLSGARGVVLSDQAKAVAEPVAYTADGVPMGYAIDRPAGRVLVLCGILEGDDLPLRTAFPILTMNALDWLAAPGGPSAGPTKDERPAAPRPAAGESDIRTPAGLATRTPVPATRPSGPPSWPVPAALAVLLLLAEWCLFQRRWIC